MNRTSSELPEVLRPRVEEALSALAEGLSAASPRLRAVLPRVLAASRFVTGVLTRDPDAFARHVADGLFEVAAEPGAITGRLRAAVAGADSDQAFMAALRRERALEMARIALRDVAGWAELDETLEALSELADAACQHALAQARTALQARFGTPRNDQGEPVSAYVLGMGKLGGRELNYSSDIDLIFGYTAGGETDGPRKVANEQYFEALVRHFTRLLAERTGDGFVFRVDWMLRPFGASGPPVMHSDAMDEYYQVHGREWERYAFIKARSVAGDLEAGRELLHTLQPFVYRRYLDFNAVGALRELKHKIAGEVRRKDLHDNIKLGAGGIRELEFIVQAFQLVRGGQEAGLRGNRLRPVLHYLGQAGYLPAEAVRVLDEAYVFLRRLENAVQMYQDEQTHELPVSPEARAALCMALGFAGWRELTDRLQAVRAQVQEEFTRVFAEPESPAPERGGRTAFTRLWGDLADGDGARRTLEQLGYRQDPAGVYDALQTLRGSHLTRTLSETSQRRLEALVAGLIAEALKEKSPDTALMRVLRVLHAIAGRATYLTLLRESQTARTQLLRLCAASPWITEFIARNPILLDQLLDVRSLYAPPDRDQIRAELDQLFTNVPDGETEAAMDALRRFQQEVTLRVAAADLVEALPLVRVSDRLTWLAEAIVQKTLDLTHAEMLQDHGEPYNADGAPVGFAVIAYGKFGGIEMGYGSDLDVIFLHDCDDLQRETTGGHRPLANETWLARLAQRIIHWLSTQTSAGRAYAVDLELRPDGRRGLTVSSIARFERYQGEKAWTWEHQALTRARPVAGDAKVRDTFNRVRAEVLTRARDADKLRQEVLDMRQRMRVHRDRSTTDRFDVKQGTGGLTDIEFITQYLVLRHAHAHPALVEWPDNWRQTEALVKAAVLGEVQARTLIDTYRAYRAWLHERDLQQEEPLAETGRFQAQRERIVAVWNDVLEHP